MTLRTKVAEAVADKPTEPSKRWRNHWRIPRRLYDDIEQRWWNPGDTLRSIKTWRTKDLAETDAQACIERGITKDLVYLGAFPAEGS